MGWRRCPRTTARAHGCNGPVVEEELNLDRAARRRIQQGLAAGGFEPGGADGLFADAGGDTAVAVVARRSVDRLSERCVGRGAADGGWVGSGGGRAVTYWMNAGGSLVDPPRRNLSYVQKSCGRYSSHTVR